jgi:hypothetical protein
MTILLFGAGGLVAFSGVTRFECSTQIPEMLVSGWVIFLGGAMMIAAIALGGA